jgi:DNA-binding LytR/AlgR family response regulator
MQVHRSHWVTHSAVKNVEKGKNNVFLHLVDGSKIPVSRKYLKQVCNADWFK